jgi:hypothetical protein
MLLGALADLVVVVHLGFILFVAIGPLLAWRWRWVVWLHLPALVWAGIIVFVGAPCPLTALEKWLRRRAGQRGYQGGFVDHYLRDVLYPGRYTAALRVVVAAVIVIGYVGLARRTAQRARVSTAPLA